MQKKLAALFLLLLLCSSCGRSFSQYTEMSESVEPETTESLQAQELLFLVDVSLDNTFLEGAERFAEHIYDITDGMLTVTVRRSSGTAAHFLAGRAQLTFLGSRGNSALCDSFAALSTPFLYSDHDIFTMAANSERALALVQDTMKPNCQGVPLGAFYRPSHQLITTWQPADYLQFTRVRIAVDPASGSRRGFALLGASVNDEPDSAERMQLLIDGWVEGAEFTMEELDLLGWNRDDLPGGDLALDHYLTMTYHTIDPVWLVANEQFYQNLPERYRAALTEATSYLYADIDLVYTSKEREVVQRLLSAGMLDGRDFSAARTEIISSMQEESDSEEPDDTWLAYVQNMVRALE